MVDLQKNLARRLRDLRGEQTQREFARVLGIEQPHLHRIEHGEENITLKTIQKISDRLKCGVGWLFDDDRGASKKK